MNYKVIVAFEDIQDNRYPYSVGDTYPRKGLIVTAERCKELATRENRRRQPLIEWIDEQIADAVEEENPKMEVVEEDSKVDKRSRGKRKKKGE